LIISRQLVAERFAAVTTSLCSFSSNLRFDFY